MAKKKSKSKSTTSSDKSKAPSATRKKASKKQAKAAKKSSSKGKRSAEPVVVTHDQIAKRAFELWMDRGQPTDQEQIIWHAAEAELLGR